MRGAVGADLAKSYAYAFLSASFEPKFNLQFAAAVICQIVCTKNKGRRQFSLD